MPQKEWKIFELGLLLWQFVIVRQLIGQRKITNVIDTQYLLYRDKLLAPRRYKKSPSRLSRDELLSVIRPGLEPGTL